MFTVLKIYEDVQKIIYQVYNALWSAIPLELIGLATAAFSLFVLAYAIMYLRGDIKQPLNQVATMIVGLIIVFNLTMQSNSFRKQFFYFPIKFPYTVSDWIIGHSNDAMKSQQTPGQIQEIRNSPQSNQNDQVFDRILDHLLKYADHKRGKVSGIPSVESLKAYMAASLVFLVYIAYWILRFAHLMGASIYVIYGMFVLYTLPFPQLRHLFWEWLRNLGAYMLIPPLTSILMAIIIRSLTPFTLQASLASLNKSTASADSNLASVFIVSVLAIYGFKNVPGIAASLTRGSVMKLPGAVGIGMAAAAPAAISGAAAAAYKSEKGKAIREGIGKGITKITSAINKKS